MRRSANQLLRPLARNFSSSSYTKKKKSDLVVVLDMDECLLHSQFFGSTDYRQKEHRPDQVASHQVESFQIELSDGDMVHVNKRPGLELFLQKCSQRFETHVFTAAMEVYASPVLDCIDPDNEYISKRFYRESCTVNSELGVYVKDLGHILYNTPKTDQNKSPVDIQLEYEVNDKFKRVVLVDNNPLSFLAQPSNGVLVSNFYDNANDQTLNAVLELLDKLDEIEDVRPALDEMFGLKEALGQLHGSRKSI